MRTVVRGQTGEIGPDAFIGVIRASAWIDNHRLAPEPDGEMERIEDTLDRPEERQRMGELGYARLHRDLNWQKSVEQLLAAYQAALR